MCIRDRFWNEQGYRFSWRVMLIEKSGWANFFVVNLNGNRKEIELSSWLTKNQEKMVKHTQELINKFRAKKNKAAFAQSLIKKLDKLEDIEIDQLEKDGIQFKFPEPSHSGKETLKIAGLEKKYGDKEIFSNVDLSISRGEKIALIGKNGMGKSTFIKSIVKDISYNGNIQLGHQVMMGYFAQDEAHKLDPKKTVFQTIDDVAVGEVRKNIRQILGSFLFSGDILS